MPDSPADHWEEELDRWLEPFLQRLRRKAQRRWAPFYLKGLILPGERKSVEPMAARVAPGDVQQLHHFVSTSPWATVPLEDELVKAADRLVGGPGAVLVVDDTCLVKQGRRSVGVKRQYCGRLGKKANCQALVSLTLARAEVPVCVGLRLFLPEDWCADAERRVAAGVPETVQHRPKWAIALDEIDRVLASGGRFGTVLADAEYGKAAEFRHGLAERQLSFAVGILPMQKVYPADVALSFPERKPTGRPRKHPVPSAASVEAAELIEARPEAFRTISWRTGTKGQLKAAFAASRVRVADGPVAARGRHLPGEGRERRSRRARRRAPRHGRAQVLPIQPPARHAARGPGRLDQGPLGLRAGAPAAQGRAGAGPLRGPELAWAPSPRALVPARVRLPPAPPARGGKAAPARARPDHRPDRACRRCAAASSPR
jgi:SRSO17 transposase